MRSLQRWIYLGAVLAVFASASGARGGTITTNVVPFTGADASVKVVLDDMADPGNIVITLTVEASPNTGDLRGFFFDVSDDLLLTGLSVSGMDVTGSAFGADAVIDLGGGNNLAGSFGPCPCDAGVSIGLPGIGSGDDIQTTTFTLSHETESLDLSLLEGQLIGVRLTSVGEPWGTREASSKLVGTVPELPEPSTGLLFALGLAAAIRRR